MEEYNKKFLEQLAAFFEHETKQFVDKEVKDGRELINQKQEVFLEKALMMVRVWTGITHEAKKFCCELEYVKKIISDDVVLFALLVVKLCCLKTTSNILLNDSILSDLNAGAESMDHSLFKILFLKINGEEFFALSFKKLSTFENTMLQLNLLEKQPSVVFENSALIAASFVSNINGRTTDSILFKTLLRLFVCFSKSPETRFNWLQMVKQWISGDHSKTASIELVSQYLPTITPEEQLMCDPDLLSFWTLLASVDDLLIHCFSDQSARACWEKFLFRCIKGHLNDFSCIEVKNAVFLLSWIHRSEEWRKLIATIKAMSSYEMHLVKEVLPYILQNFSHDQSTSKTEHLRSWWLLPLCAGLRSSNPSIIKLLANSCVNLVAGFPENWSSAFFVDELLPVFADSSFYRVGRKANGEADFPFNVGQEISAAIKSLSQTMVLEKRKTFLKSLINVLSNTGPKTPFINVVLSSIAALPDCPVFNRSDCQQIGGILSELYRDYNSASLCNRSRNGIVSGILCLVKHADYDSVDHISISKSLTSTRLLIKVGSPLYEIMRITLSEREDLGKRFIAEKLLDPKSDSLFCSLYLGTQMVSKKFETYANEDEATILNFLSELKVLSCSPDAIFENNALFTCVRRILKKVTDKIPDESFLQVLDLIVWLCSAEKASEEFTKHSNLILKSIAEKQYQKLQIADDISSVIAAMNILPLSVLTCKSNEIFEHVLIQQCSAKISVQKWILLRKLANFGDCFGNSEKVIELCLEELTVVDSSSIPNVIEVLVKITQTLPSEMVETTVRKMGSCGRGIRFQEDTLVKFAQSMLNTSLALRLIELGFSSILHDFWADIFSLSSENPKIMAALAKHLCEDFLYDSSLLQQDWTAEVVELFLHHFQRQPFEMHDRQYARNEDLIQLFNRSSTNVLTAPRAAALILATEHMDALTVSLVVQNLLNTNEKQFSEISFLLPNSKQFLKKLHLWQALVLLVDKVATQDLSQLLWTQALQELSNKLPSAIKDVVEATVTKLLIQNTKLFWQKFCQMVSWRSDSGKNTLLTSLISIFLEILRDGENDIVVEEIKNSGDDLLKSLVALSSHQNSYIRFSSQFIMHEFNKKRMMEVAKNETCAELLEMISASEAVQKTIEITVQKSKVLSTTEKFTLDKIVSCYNDFGEYLPASLSADVKENLKQALFKFYVDETPMETNNDQAIDSNIHQQKIEPMLQTKVEDEESCKSSLVVVASLLEKIPNLGGLCRTCEIFGAEKLILPNLNVTKTKLFSAASRESEKWVNLEECRASDLVPFLEKMRKSNYRIVALEQSSSSISLQSFKFPSDMKICVLLGVETTGVPANLLSFVDDCIEIPQFGVIRSLNVHVSASVLIWEYLKQTRLCP